MLKDKVKQAIKELFDAEPNSYELSRQTGVTRQLIDRYRNDPDKIGSMKLENAAALYDYKKEMDKMKINHLRNVLQFDSADFEGVYYRDDNDDFHAVDEDEYEWLEELDQAIDFLEENGLEIEANEYQDYIDEAERIREEIKTNK